MSKRSIIIAKVVRHISLATGTFGKRGLKFLQEVNDFPSFYIYAGDENRYHEGAGNKYAVISCALRGYVESENLVDVENYARDLEEAIQTFAQNNRDLLEDIRVVSLRTDEGLMAPYGIIDLQIEILYNVLISNIYTTTDPMTADSIDITVDEGY